MKNLAIKSSRRKFSDLKRNHVVSMPSRTNFRTYDTCVFETADFLELKEKNFCKNLGLSILVVLGDAKTVGKHHETRCKHIMVCNPSLVLKLFEFEFTVVLYYIYPGI